MFHRQCAVVKLSAALIESGNVKFDRIGACGRLNLSVRDDVILCHMIMIFQVSYQTHYRCFLCVSILLVSGMNDLDADCVVVFDAAMGQSVIDVNCCFVGIAGGINFAVAIDYELRARVVYASMVAAIIPAVYDTSGVSRLGCFC